MKVRDLVIQSFIAAVYTVLTLFLYQFSYGELQIRFSEFMLILVLFHRRNSAGLILGCFIANLFSPYGWPDVVFGTLATALACGLMTVTKNHTMALLWPAIANGIIIGIQLNVIVGAPLILTMIYVALGEFVATFIVGGLIYAQIKESRAVRGIFA